MRLLIIALAALPIGAATAGPAPVVQTVTDGKAAPAVTRSAPKQPIQFVELDPEKQCPEPLLHELDPSKSPGPKKLTELPPADAYHAVYRRDEDGCLDPVMVGYQHENQDER